MNIWQPTSHLQIFSNIVKRVLFLLSQQPVILAGFYDLFDIPDGIYFTILLVFVIHEGLFIQNKRYTGHSF